MQAKVYLFENLLFCLPFPTLYNKMFRKFEKLLISSKLSHTQIHNKTRDTETGSLTFGNDVLKDQKIESNGLIGQNVLFFTSLGAS